MASGNALFWLCCTGKNAGSKLQDSAKFRPCISADTIKALGGSLIDLLQDHDGLARAQPALHDCESAKSSGAFAGLQPCRDKRRALCRFEGGGSKTLDLGLEQLVEIQLRLQVQKHRAQ